MKHSLAARSDYRSRIFLMIVVVVFFMYEYSLFISLGDTKFDDGESLPFDYYQVPTNYLINTPTCKIPDIDPFRKDTGNHVHKAEHLQCRKLKWLTFIEKLNETIILRVRTSLLHLYSTQMITCCYSNVTRNNKSGVDNVFTYSPCSTFQEYTIITHPFIKVTCSDPRHKVYANVHAVTIPTKKQLEASGDRKGVFSILLFGIGGISKSHLKRTMPKTYKHLERHFINLRGYNNIGDDTYRNLMAILTGRAQKLVEKRCGDGKKLRSEQGVFIWEVFKNLSYVTTYAEDSCAFGKRDFVKPHTDYYYCPYMLATEKLPGAHIKGMCAGPKSSNERILNVVKDLSISSKNVPNFGFVWMNNVSNGDANTLSAMDQKMVEFLNDPTFKSSLENTIMILFSDHGYRFGNMRYTHTGWLEERLPLLYFYIPDSFKQDYPEKYYSFLINSLRLTTPYDVHNTLQEVLELANSTYVSKRSLGCAKGQSLFKQINELRTCKDADIDQQWCTCTGHTYVNPKDFMIQLVGRFIVNQVNRNTRQYSRSKCAKFNLKKVVSAGVLESYLSDKNETLRYFLVVVQTCPNAIFEATVETQLVSERNYFKLLGDISRLDKNIKNSHWTEDAILEKTFFCAW